MANRLAWLLALVAGCFLALTLCHSRGAFAQEKDHSQWADSPHKKWYDSQEMNPAARERLGLYRGKMTLGRRIALGITGGRHEVTVL